MIIKKRIPNDGWIVCFGVNPKGHRKEGQVCGRKLMKINSNGDASGEIKCSHGGCRSVYEIKDGYIYLMKQELP